MFVPTIKYKKVNADKNEPTLGEKKINLPKPAKQQQQQQSNTVDSSTISKGNNTDSQMSNELETVAPIISQLDGNAIATATTTTTHHMSFEEKDDATITVDPGDDERILITLSDGITQYTADRYCPHAGADLSYLGQVDEDEYPPEIGPILLCTLHYWEFALKKAGRGANGVATINACPFVGGINGESGDVTCHAKNKLDW